MKDITDEEQSVIVDLVQSYRSEMVSLIILWYKLLSLVIGTVYYCSFIGKIKTVSIIKYCKDSWP